MGQQLLAEVESIDGNPGSWALKNTYQTRKQEWSYAYAWTDSTLVLTLILPPNPQQAQTLLTGMTWWVQPGKKQSLRGFRFPLGAGPEDMPRNPDALHQALIELPETYERFLPADQGLELIHWPARGDTSLADNPQAQMAFAGGMQDDGVLVLEAKIPWSIWDISPDSLGGAIRFRAETGKLSRPNDLKRQDGNGISGGSISNPTYTTDTGMRRRWLLLDQYRDFSQPAAIKTQKLELERRTP
ncbi:MAG: hypothetical protein AAFV07_01035 [Bacteroidota bacterium]